MRSTEEVDSDGDGVVVVVNEKGGAERPTKASAVTKNETANTKDFILLYFSKRRLWLLLDKREDYLRAKHKIERDDDA